MKIRILGGLLVLFACMLTSCGSSDNDDPTPSGNDLVLSVTPDVIAGNGQEKARFTVKDGDKDVTFVCTIEETSSGERVKDGVFSALKTGEYTFVAKWGKRISNEVKVDVVGSVAFVRNALIVESTSTYCVYCPTMAEVIRELRGRYPDRIHPIAMHTTGMDKGTNKDPMAIREYDDAWRSHFGISGFPTAIIDYYQLFKADSPTSIVANILDEPGYVGIAISTKLDGRELTLDVKVKSAVNPEKPGKLIVALTEDGIIAAQTGGGTDYEHEWVLRKYLTTLFGNQLAEGDISRDKEYTKTFQYTVDEHFNPQKMHAIVGLIDSNTGRLINCQRVKLGESVDYQYLN